MTREPRRGLRRLFVLARLKQPGGEGESVCSRAVVFAEVQRVRPGLSPVEGCIQRAMGLPRCGVLA